jgi:hypothetical protein
MLSMYSAGLHYTVYTTCTNYVKILERKEGRARNDKSSSSPKLHRMGGCRVRVSAAVDQKGGIAKEMQGNRVLYEVHMRLINEW